MESYQIKIQNAAIELLADTVVHAPDGSITDASVEVDSMAIPLRGFNDNQKDKDEIFAIVHAHDGKPAHESNPNLPDRKITLTVVANSMTVYDKTGAKADALIRELHMRLIDRINAVALETASGLHIYGVLHGEEREANTPDEILRMADASIILEISSSTLS